MFFPASRVVRTWERSKTSECEWEARECVKTKRKGVNAEKRRILFPELTVSKCIGIFS